ncbi:hypothetical protein HY642_07305, partial [Candidatus Woesearchaeota archaeon]|nr:hypothetical protein [Candidatus Woesearchaeota archaeon]
VIEGAKAVPNEVLPRIEKLKPRFLVFSGHGNRSTLEGHEGVVLINKDNCGCLRGLIVFSRACDALAGLGNDAVSQGCLAFAGYEKQFWGVATDGYASRPAQDPNARDIYENSNVVPLQVLKGKNIEGAIHEANRDAAKRILKLLDSHDPAANATLLALSWNDSILSFKGDAGAVL